VQKVTESQKSPARDRILIVGFGATLSGTGCVLCGMTTLRYEPGAKKPEEDSIPAFAGMPGPKRLNVCELLRIDNQGKRSACQVCNDKLMVG
jgi:hypothetical protein